MTEKELLTQYRESGNIELLGKLFVPYMSLLYGVCFKYLRHESKSQDAVMNIFEELVDKLKVHEVENFKGWLYTLTRNHCLMQIRKEKNIQEVDIQDHLFESESTLTFWEDSGEDEIRLQKLKDCLEQLNDHQQKSVRLFYIEKKCYQDIVNETGYEMKKVKSYIQNGKRNLKICIELKK